jgi:hypothetical protein
VRAWLRRNHAWVTFRRVQREGFPKAWRRWRLWTRILGTPAATTRVAGEGEPVEVHLLCYRDDYLCAIWALKSFYKHAAVDWPLTIHIQGEAPARVGRRLRAHFPQARIVAQREADGIVNRHLARHGWQRLLSARAANHYMLKLTDYRILSGARRLITLDSDVLFFQRPAELLEFTGTHLFQRDPESTYLVPGIPGVRIAPRLNVGIMSFLRESISLARCDEYLGHFRERTGWLEQTLYALHASETGTATCLPDTYLISLEAGIDAGALVARHYAGPSRHLLTEEGMPYILRACGPPPTAT